MMIMVYMVQEVPTDLRSGFKNHSGQEFVEGIVKEC